MAPAYCELMPMRSKQRPPKTQHLYFVCCACGTALTRTLTVRDDRSYIFNRDRAWHFGLPLFPEGLVIRERGEYGKEYSGWWLVQEEDITGLEVTPIVARTYGCCGMSGGRGHNLVCRSCGEHVACAETDCSCLQCVALDPLVVRPVRVRATKGIARSPAYEDA